MRADGRHAQVDALAGGPHDVHRLADVLLVGVVQLREVVCEYRGGTSRG